MKRLLKRINKLALLAKIVEGRLTHNDISEIRKSWEPIYLTLKIGDEANSFEQSPDALTYHIEVYTDGTTKCYDRYLDGCIKFRTS